MSYICYMYNYAAGTMRSVTSRTSVKSGLAPIVGLLLLLLAGCGKEDGAPPAADEEMVGEWVLDWEASAPLIEQGMQEKIDKLPPERRTAEEPMLRQVLEHMKTSVTMRLDLRRDGTYAFEFLGGPPHPKQTSAGRWTKTGSAVELVAEGSPPMRVVREQGLLRFTPRADAPDQGFYLRKR